MTVRLPDTVTVGNGLLVPASALEKRPALDLVVAARLPERGVRTGGRAFDVTGDVTVDCDVEDDQTGKRCGWHAMGSRADVQRAQAEHVRMYHSQHTGPIVTMLNLPRQ